MASHPFNLPPSFDGEARLFPLPDLVMFPSTLLPLHIFESRYREMLEDAMRGDQLIAMATLIPGFEDEYYTRAPVAPVVCIGRVTDYEKTASGTYNLMLIGLKRAEIESEIEPVRSFRRARVKLIEDPASPANDVTQRIGLQLADRLREALPAAEGVIERFMDGEISLASLSDVAAFHLPLPTEVKLELLAEANALVRTERLLEQLPSAKSVSAKRTRYGSDFSAN